MFDSSSRSTRQRLLDWLFGRDFFISYRWSDGREYAVRLAERLKAERFDCFLDSQGFVKGDNWQRIGERELRKTSRLLLVGSPQVHDSKAVLRELQIFGAKNARIIAIEFGDSLSSTRFPDSPVLSLLDPHGIRQCESADALTREPSDAVLAELRRTFIGETTTVRRLRAIQMTAALLFALMLLATTAAVLAYRQYRANVEAAALADTQRAGTEMEGSNLDQAVGYLIRSLRKNPGDASAASALMRLSIEQPPVVPQRVADGKFADVQISREGNVVVMRRDDGVVFVSRDIASAVPLDVGERRISHVALAPGGSALAVAANEAIAFIPLGGKVGTDVVWRQFPVAISALAVGDDGSVLIGDAAGNVYSFANAKPNEVRQLGDSTGRAVRSVALMDVPLLGAAIDENGQWRVWNAEGDETGRGASDVEKGMGAVFTASGLVWAANHDPGELEGDGPRSQIVASGDSQGWNNLLSSPEWPRTRIAELSADDQGRSCVALMDSDEVVLAGRMPDRNASLARPGVSAVAFSTDGAVVTSAHFDRSLRRWEGEHLAPLGGIAYAPPGVVRAVSNADGSRVALVTRDGVWLCAFPAEQGHANPSLTPSVVADVLPKSFRSLEPAEKRLSSAGGRRVKRIEASDVTEGAWEISGAGPPLKITHGMTRKEALEWEGVRESSHFAVMPGTMAAVSGDGSRVATSAAAQPVRIWKARTGKTTAEIDSGTGDYPFFLAFSGDGRWILAAHTKPSGNRSYYRIYDVRSGAPVTEAIPLYSGEVLCDATPDLSRVLITTGEAVEVRETQTARVLAGPVSLNYVAWFAGFAAEGRCFVLATRDGRFRVWRTADAMPLCGISTFHADAPNYQGIPGDAYHFSVWEETPPSASFALRRLAFKIENMGTVGGPPVGYRLFDLGLAGTRSDHGQIANLMSDIYGLDLSETGNLIRREPASASDLTTRYLSRSSWETSDPRLLAEWLIRERHQRKVTPFSEGRK